MHTIQQRKANWLCHMLHRICFLNMLQLKDRDGKTRKMTLENTG